MKKVLGGFSLLLLISSCSTDFDTMAPYKETTVVYGLLNPNDNIQYIRIGKAYLGEGNALIMAQQPDSIYYQDILEVRMQRFINNNQVASYELVRLDTVPKDAGGDFAAPYQIVYADTNHVSGANDGSTYRITVTNKQTGNVVTSSTRIVDNFTIYTPTELNVAGGNPESPITFRCTTSVLGRIYGMTMKLNYRETNLADSTTTNKTLTWYLGDQVTTGGTVTSLNFFFKKSDFFKFLNASIEVDPGKSRAFTSDPVVVYISGGTEEMYTYMQVTNLNSGIASDKPLYTNVENGVGLFTSRNQRLRHMSLSVNTLNALDTSVYTRDLNFVH